MYAYLKGILIEAQPTYVILEAQQIGFQIAIPTHTYGRLPPLGHTIKLFTAFIIRENSQSLYGFLTHAEKQLFEALLDVSGIGPKLSLSLCGHLPPEELLAAIARNDIPLITKVPGIGKKTAERLILDLRDKTTALLAHVPSDFQIATFADQRAADALSALLHLGYTQAAAQKALKKTLQDNPDQPLGDLITSALKNIL